MAAATPAKLLPKTCPACNALIIPRRMRCVKCNMDFAHIDEFMAAKKAAEKKLRLRAKTGDSDYQKGARSTRLILRVGGLVLLLWLVGWGGWKWFQKAHADPYAGFPTDRQALVTQFLTLISTDDNQNFEKAYDLVSANVKRPGDTDDRSDYKQIFHDMNGYLGGEFGPDWIKLLRVDAPTSLTQTTLTVHVVTETLHIDVAHQMPKEAADKLAAAGPETLTDNGTMRFGVKDIQEFTVDEAADSRKTAAIGGVLRGEGAGGAIANIEAIRSTYGAHPSPESPLQIKKRLLAEVRRPNNPAIIQDIYQLWPARKDATIQARLEAIMSDTRYSEHAQQVAKEVHDSMASEDELVAAGVTETWDAKP